MATPFKLTRVASLKTVADFRAHCANVGADLARFIDVAGKVDDWPPRMKYEDGTEISSGTLNQLFN